MDSNRLHEGLSKTKPHSPTLSQIWTDGHVAKTIQVLADKLGMSVWDPSKIVEQLRYADREWLQTDNKAIFSSNLVWKVTISLHVVKKLGRIENITNWPRTVRIGGKVNSWMFAWKPCKKESKGKILKSEGEGNESSHNSLQHPEEINRLPEWEIMKWSK